MPRISAQTWEDRRQHILNAAWRCFEREGLQATTMEQIIVESGMAASAMYRYFKGREDILYSAMTTSLAAFAAQIQPIIARGGTLPPDTFVLEVMRLMDKFSQREGFNLKSMAIQGWGEAQGNPKLHDAIMTSYAAFLKNLSDVARQWKSAGTIGASSSPAAVARTPLSLILGYMVQSTLLPATTPASHGKGLLALLP